MTLTADDPGSDWWTQAQVAAGFPIADELLANAGLNGNRTDQMAARVASDVLAYAPDWVTVLGGANDLPAGRTAAQIQGSLTSIYDDVTATGARVIAFTIGPRTGIDTTQAQVLRDVNTWLRANFESTYPGSLLCDWSPTLSENGDDADPVDAYFADGLHFTSSGASAAAGEVAATLNRIP